MSLFERYLTLWVGLAIIAGIALGHLLPQVFEVIGTLEIAKVNLPVAALIWLFVVQRDFGALNMTLDLVGIPPKNWIGDTHLVIPSIAMLEVWRGVGFWTLLFLAALLGLPRELYQAATIDGANAFQRFIHLTLPLMRPTFFFAVVMATIWNFQLFDSVSILTDGGPANASVTVVWYIYKAMFQFNDKTGFAAALSFVLLAFILALTAIEIRLLRKRAA